MCRKVRQSVLLFFEANRLFFEIVIQFNDQRTNLIFKGFCIIFITERKILSQCLYGGHCHKILRCQLGVIAPVSNTVLVYFRIYLFDGVAKGLFF